MACSYASSTRSPRTEQRPQSQVSETTEGASVRRCGRLAGARGRRHVATARRRVLHHRRRRPLPRTRGDGEFTAPTGSPRSGHGARHRPHRRATRRAARRVHARRAPARLPVEPVAARTADLSGATSRVVVYLDADVIVTEPLGDLLEAAAQGAISAFPDVGDRWFPQWHEIFDLARPLRAAALRQRGLPRLLGRSSPVAADAMAGELRSDPR